MSKLYTIESSKGMQVTICEYGASIVSIYVYDKDGKRRDVALGFDEVQKYADNPSNFGATVGRVAGRIGNATFTLNGVVYELEKNDGDNCLHSGSPAFAGRLWSVKEDSVTGSSIVLQYTSKDMEQGMPGNLDLQVKYSLSEDNELIVEYWGTTDKDTPVNLTNHTYFNLDGNPKKDVYDYVLKMYSDSYLETDEGALPTGKVLSVENTPFDFRSGKRIGQDIDCLSAGYNHNYVTKATDEQLVKAVEVYSPESGICLEIETNDAGLQLYTAYYLDSKEIGKGQIPLASGCGVCFETQGYPNAVNHPEFKSVVLKVGEQYSRKTLYRFSIKEDMR